MITRRQTIKLVAGLSPLLLLSRARGDDGACDSLGSLSRSQRRLRDVVGFQIQTKDDRMCKGCAFFTGAANTPNCGSCELLNDGPVYTTSVCDSWGDK